MIWNAQQEQALRAVSRWLRDPSQQLFRLFGYAGTGKTTLAKHLAADVDGDVYFGAYTGKAAHVLKQRGCHNAKTIHSMIYTSNDRSKQKIKELEAQLLERGNLLRAGAPKGLSEERLGEWINNDVEIKRLRELLAVEHRNAARPSFSLNTDAEIGNAELIVVDECSMVDATMGADLLSFKVKVLVLGDPAQLPPVMGGGFFTECEPDIMLTDIQRQARDNPIIELATRVRNQQALRPGRYGESSVVERVGAKEAMAADQILVGRNRTRHGTNDRVRNLQGRTSEFPEPGDRLVCLRNNSDLGLLNGALFDTVRCDKIGDKRLGLTIVPAEAPDQEIECEAHTGPLLGDDKDVPFWERKEAEEFSFGYALTVHKAQGSQWPRVVLFDEASAFREHRWRWLYTGITRAAEVLTVVET